MMQNFEENMQNRCFSSVLNPIPYLGSQVLLKLATLLDLAQYPLYCQVLSICANTLVVYPDRAISHPEIKSKAANLMTKDHLENFVAAKRSLLFRKVSSLDGKDPVK